MIDSTEILTSALRTIPISVQSADRPDRPRTQGFLVGSHHKDFLLFGGLKDFLPETGESLVVRMLLGNEVVGFNTTVSGQITDVPPVWQVSYPDKVEAINLRKSPRVAVFFPTDVRAKRSSPVEDAVQLLRGIVLNISNGGCRFSSKTAVPSKEQVNLSFSLPGDRLVFNITGEVLETGRHRQVFSQRVRFINGSMQMGPLSQIGQWVQENAPFSFY